MAVQPRKVQNKRTDVYRLFVAEEVGFEPTCANQSRIGTDLLHRGLCPLFAAGLPHPACHPRSSGPMTTPRWQ
ncbi:MAG: hypothetical protein PHE41_05540 [Eubacteriales bacterium]|nr:hypothetical protein [Eubacteriales bacterium]